MSGEKQDNVPDPKRQPSSKTAMDYPGGYRVRMRWYDDEPTEEYDVIHDGKKLGTTNGLGEAKQIVREHRATTDKETK